MGKHERDDVTADPRLDDGSNEVDWAAEGGALPEGPATDPEDDETPAPPSLAEDAVPEDR